MFCPNCGKEIKDGSQFCGNCGATIKKNNQKEKEIIKNVNSSNSNNKTKKGFNIIPLLIVLILVGVGVFAFIKLKDNIFSNNKAVSSTEKTVTGAKKTEKTDNRGWVETSKGWNYYDKNGYKLVNQIVEDEYFVDSSGYMVRGSLIEHKGKKYYFDENGKMVKNQWVMDTYYVGDDGAVLVNTTTPDGYKVGSDGKWDKTFEPPLKTKIQNTPALKDYPIGSSLSDFQTVTFGSYQQNDVLGSTKEPIEWLVVDKYEDRALLVSKFILDKKPYNTYRTATSWESSYVRRWLNNEFYDNAFSNVEKESIMQSPLVNSPNTLYSVSSGPNTLDNVFILSETELTVFVGQFNMTLSNTKLISFETPYSSSLNLTIEQTAGKSNHYWVRTAGISLDTAQNVHPDGALYIPGAHVERYLGIRPAIWVKLG